MSAPVHIILPGAEGMLLRRELALGFAAAGRRVTMLDPEALQGPQGPASLAALLDGAPALLFSVNFQGLARLRDVLDVLERGKARAAVWCVDNPWNLLSGVRDPRWKGLDIFVTDASFIAPLQAHGAQRVFHLPLAASFELFAPDARRDALFPPPEDMAPLVFVGRSAFPGRERFFAGQKTPAPLLAQARALLEQGQRPDLAWWERRPGTEKAPFWPGKKARQPALGAEEANLAWRGMCLEAATSAGARLNADGAQPTPSGPARFDSALFGLDLFGDSGWQDHLPAGARLRPPVDYYARLPGIYARARYSLCLTSLQLPAGLNQRHFDVWAAGGVLLTDATPGLALFPEELTRPVTFRRAGDIAALALALEKMDRRRLVADWQDLIMREHSYAVRARQVLERLF